MSPLIDIIGVGADGRTGLRPEVVQRIEAAEFLAGGERHLGYFPEVPAQRWIIKDNLSGLMAELGARRHRQRCVVLASGDPLFYGVASWITEELGPADLRIEPALSSMQLAFARASTPWHEARLASIHGRDLRPTLLPLLGQTLIGLFTPDGLGPAAVARFFLRYGLGDYHAMVGENLGAADERVTDWVPLEDLLYRQFAPLNYLILSRDAPPSPKESVMPLFRRHGVPGIPDDWFARPDDRPAVMTSQDVRSIVIARLSKTPVAADTFWDIGAGLGTVAVEMAVLRPGQEVVAVEQDPHRVRFLRENRERFEAYNIRVIAGTAPEALRAETEWPRSVFLGGSGGRLAAILEFVRERLRPRGRLVANFVVLEHLTEMLARVKAWGWPFEVTEISVSRSDGLAGFTGLKPQRSVFLVQADKPEEGHA